MVKVRFIKQVWMCGSSTVVTIPRRIREELKIEKGDYVEVWIRKV